MKLATLKDGSRDGKPVVVSCDLTRCTDASFLARTLQAALDDWTRIAPHLAALAESLEHGSVPSQRFHEHDAHSPLPRAYQRAGGSNAFVAPRDPIPIADDSREIGCTAGLAVVVDDLAAGASGEEAREAIRLVMLVNDVTLRAPTGPESDFFQSKPFSAFSPVAVTPDELGAAWDGTMVHSRLSVELNGKPFGNAGAGVDTASEFPALIARAARTRPLSAGAIIGSDAFSDRTDGELKAPPLRLGDTVRIEMKDSAGRSIFGAIQQTVEKAGR